MAHTTPTVRPAQNGFLLNFSRVAGMQANAIAIEGPAWLEWLEQNRAFRFESPEGSFSARREQRPGGWYWYASRRVQGRLHTVYLGRSHELHAQRLIEVARELATRGEPPVSHVQTSASTELHVPEHTLLLTKLNIPKQRTNLLPRPHLVAHLEQCRHHKLTLISTPAGFGKTTLLGEWLRLTSMPMAWLSLDTQDNDPVRFWRYILAALEQHLPALSASIVPLLRQPGSSTLQGALVMLLNELATLSEDVCLVLDDYHEIQTPEIHQSLTFLLEYLPAHVHLLIASRTAPPLPLARLRADDELLELPVTSLRFTEDETLTLLRQTTSLPAETTKALAERTEGWIAGLQLAIFSLRSHADSAQFIASFTGRSRHIVDYLTSEVLKRLPTDQFTFLTRTSVLSRLNASLCDTVLSQQTSQAMLEQLEQSQLFLFPLDDERQWYHYHQLFAAVLRQRLTEQEPELISELQRRAATWCAANNLPDEAIEYALAARDIATVVRLLERSAEPLIRAGESSTIRSWLDALPEQLLRSNPLLSCYYAFLLLIHSQFTAVEARLQDAEHAIELAHLPEQDPATRRLRAMIDAARSTVAINLGDTTATILYAQRALDRLEEHDLSLRGVVLHNLGEAWEDSNNLDAAIQAYHQAIAINYRGGNIFVTVTALGSLARLEARQGRIQQASETCHRALLLARTRPDRPDILLPSAGKPMLLLGELLYAQHDLASALTHTLRGIELARVWTHQGHMIEGHLLLARIYQARGETVAAHDAIQIAQRLVDEASANERRQRNNKLAALATEVASARKALASPTPSLPVGQELSERELAILRLLANGLSNREIAEQLILTPGTVKWYTHEIYSKLGTHSRTRAIAEARRLHIL